MRRTSSRAVSAHRRAPSDSKTSSAWLSALLAAPHRRARRSRAPRARRVRPRSNGTAVRSCVGAPLPGMRRVPSSSSPEPPRGDRRTVPRWRVPAARRGRVPVAPTRRSVRRPRQADRAGRATRSRRAATRAASVPRDLHGERLRGAARGARARRREPPVRAPGIRGRTCSSRRRGAPRPGRPYRSPPERTRACRRRRPRWAQRSAATYKTTVRIGSCPIRRVPSSASSAKLRPRPQSPDQQSSSAMRYRSHGSEPSSPRSTRFRWEATRSSRASSNRSADDST
jgi:hypothetical protein